jgi:hypothetical protein
MEVVASTRCSPDPVCRAMASFRGDPFGLTALARPTGRRALSRRNDALRYVLITSVKMSVCPSGGPVVFRPSVHTGYTREPPTAIAL